MFDKQKVEQFLEETFDAFHEASGNEDYLKRRQEFAFHMTDWLENLDELLQVYSSVSKGTDLSAEAKERYTRCLAGFIYHVVPHLNAAGRLLVGEVPDPFAVPQD